MIVFQPLVDGIVKVVAPWVFTVGANTTGSVTVAAGATTVPDSAPTVKP